MRPSRRDRTPGPRLRLAIRACASVALAVLMAATAVPDASAATIAQLRARMNEIESEFRQAGREVDEAYWRLDETEVRIERTDAQLHRTTEKLGVARRHLRARAREMYRRGDLSMVEVLLEAASYTDFLTRLDYLQRIGSQDARALRAYQKLRRELLAERRRLEAERAERRRAIADLRSTRARLEDRLRAARGDWASAKAALDKARAAQAVNNRLPSRVISMPGGNGLVFPVAGPCYYSDTWGASRSGGRRRHKGTDIMASRGTPCVAITSGTVRASENGLGGLCIYLHGDNGWTYYYAHLNGYAVTSGRVSAGQTIGYVGSTGNAAGGAPHLHIEFHPGGGGAVNPYPYLRAMQ